MDVMVCLDLKSVTCRVSDSDQVRSSVLNFALERWNISRESLIAILYEISRLACRDGLGRNDPREWRCSADEGRRLPVVCDTRRPRVRRGVIEIILRRT